MSTTPSPPSTNNNKVLYCLDMRAKKYYIQTTSATTGLQTCGLKLYDYPPPTRLGYDAKHNCMREEHLDPLTNTWEPSRRRYWLVADC